MVCPSRRYGPGLWPADRKKFRHLYQMNATCCNMLGYRTRFVDKRPLLLFCFYFSTFRSSFYLVDGLLWTWWVIILFRNFSYYPLRSHFSPSRGESKTYPSCQLSPDNKRNIAWLHESFKKINIQHHATGWSNATVLHDVALNVASVWPGLEDPRTIWPAWRLPTNMEY